MASNAWQGGSCGKGDAPPIGGFATAQRLASIALQRRSVAASQRRHRAKLGRTAGKPGTWTAGGSPVGVRWTVDEDERTATEERTREVRGN